MPDPKSSGRPINATLRLKLESAFGQDLSAVRIHESQGAASASSRISAKAYTQGNDIFFKPGAYAPHTDEGKRLLAHELAHMLQQRKGGPVNEEKVSKRAEDALGKL
ncbi:MAG: DUF4157 domain-containing protein [Bryobacterales bacterium]|nr:DUF4157 domain-containing protein [Bryobacterales bacterium]